MDSFTLETAVEATPDEWARAMFGDTPDLAERFIWGGLLRLPLDRQPAEVVIAGWRVTGSGDTWLRMENRSSFLHGNLLVRVDAGRVTLTTVCEYPTRRGRLVWAVLSPIHRRLTPGLLHDAADLRANLAGDHGINGRTRPEGSTRPASRKSHDYEPCAEGERPDPLWRHHRTAPS